MPEVHNQDPYATPPVKHDRTGPIVRIGIVAALLGAAAWGYASFAGQEQTALVPEAPQEQQLADAGYQVSPSTLPEATTESLPPAATPAPAPARRTAPRVEQPPVEPEPTPPAQTPVAPTPLPPIDTPPAE